MELHIEAAMLALEDSGIDKSTISTGTFLNDSIRHHMIIGEHLGIHRKLFADTPRTSGHSYLNAASSSRL